MIEKTQTPVQTAGPDLQGLSPEPPRSLRQPAIPVVHLSFSQRFDTVRVRQAFGVVGGVCKEHGATISRLFERKWPEGWITCLSVQSQTAFREETEARAWWQSLMDRLQRDLPHQRLLSRELKDERFKFTTAQLTELAGRLSGAVASR